MDRTDLLRWQHRLCWTCAESYDRTPLYVDHDHVSGLVRGWLCPACNVAEGYGIPVVIAPDGETPIVVDWDDYRANPPARRMGLMERYDLVPTDLSSWPES